MDITIIIPNYNGSTLLEKNIPSVIKAAKEYKKGLIDIVISDDHSTDDSIVILNEIIKNEKDISITLLHNKKDQGFSSNVNNAVAYAKNEILLLLNTDVIPETHFITSLVSQFENKNIFAVGSLEKVYEDGRTHHYGRSIGIWKRGFLVHSAGEVNKNNTFWASGGSSAFRKEIWGKLGGLDEVYNPFYYEDIDLSYRAWKAGYEVGFERDSIVIHEHATGVIKTENKPLDIKKIAYRNQFIFIWKNITDPSFLCSHIMWLPYHFLRAIISSDIPFFLGFVYAIRKIPYILKQRKIGRKFIKRSDKSIFSEFNS